MERLKPYEIEKRSFEIIEKELGDTKLDPMEKPVIKRVIHTTADFDYVKNLCFSKNAVEIITGALKRGADIVTDTQMAKAGINKSVLAGLGGEVHCFMSDADVAETAKKNGTTRAEASMDKAAKLGGNAVFAIGNAPTALIRLRELIDAGTLKPAAVIAVPVGFVNVVGAKELIMETDVPYIVSKGRKGGSNVAAAICNALLYMIRDGNC